MVRVRSDNKTCHQLHRLSGVVHKIGLAINKDKIHLKQWFYPEGPEEGRRQWKEMSHRKERSRSRRSGVEWSRKKGVIGRTWKEMSHRKDMEGHGRKMSHRKDMEDMEGK